MAGKLWFLADTHIGHHSVAKSRGFSSTEQHDRAVLMSIINKVDKRDTLVLLGDIAWSKQALYDMFDTMLEMYREKNASSRNVDKLPFCIKIIQGNHDKSSYLVELVNAGLINGYYSLIEYKRDGFKMVATHVPIHPACLSRWKLNIHGHLHEHTIIGEPMKYFNCSWEQHYGPVDIEYIIMKRDPKVVSLLEKLK